VEVSVREGRGIKTRPGQNEESPELHEVINMVVDDPEHQSLSVRLKDEDGLVTKARSLCQPCPNPALTQAPSPAAKPSLWHSAES